MLRNMSGTETKKNTISYSFVVLTIIEKHSFFTPPKAQTFETSQKPSY